MVGRKRRGPCASTTRKATGSKLSREATPKLSLPEISDEKISFEQNLSNYISNKTYENFPRIEIPKIKIKCKPLNIEKIIDFKYNNVIAKRISDNKRAPKTDGRSKGTKGRITRTTKQLNKKENAMVKVTTENLAYKPMSLRNHKRAFVNKQSSCATSSEVSPNISNKTILGYKRKRIPDEEAPLLEKGSLSKTCSPTKEAIKTDQNLQANTFENLQDPSSSSLNSEDQSTQGHETFIYLDDESALMELNGVNPYELVPCLENLSNKELSMKLLESENKVNSENSSSDTNNLQTIDHGNKNPLDRNKSSQYTNNTVKTTLQTAVENFLKNPQVKYVTGSTALKKGLCFSWLSNGSCSNQHCVYSHNVVNLFIKKLKRFPTKFILTEVVSMRNDALFVDVVMAAFKVISERKIPVVWVTFLTFFVFYVTEPSDSRFLKFWVNAARFFCELKENYSTARGFASLLSIFSQGESSEEWKIIEFIKLIRQPPVQVRINFALLQPVLKLNLPSEFLIEAVESCITAQKDVLQVYCFIIPKISINTLPIHVVELLLKLCKGLEEMNRKNFADDMKQRLREKVMSFKTKISDREHPLTAVFQESCIDAKKENLPAGSDLSEESDLINFEAENNYFLPEGDFCNLLTQVMDLSPETVPSPYRKTEDVGERQVSRIKQFFRDCRFDLLGKYLNDLKPNVTELAAKELLKLLYQMKISLQQGVDLVKIILLPCKSENAAKIIASISITLILNLVRINEWKKAYEILSMCQEKNINLVEGKVFYCNEMNTVTQCRIVLLLVEIYTYKGNYANAVALVKKHNLFSSNMASWQLRSKAQDETIRIRILEDLLEQVISNQVTEETYDLFQMIWKDQNQLHDPVDLKKFINEVLILLLNQENEEAIKVYEQVKDNVRLKDTTARAILVSLVRRNLLSAAKSLVLSNEQSAYFLPEITPTSASLKVCSFWLEEEIYTVLSAFFDLLILNIPNFDLVNFSNVELILHESKSNLAVGLRPLCLGIINPSFKDASTRIQRVLQHQFKPPVKLIIMPYSLKLEESSLKSHLQKRINQG